MPARVLLLLAGLCLAPLACFEEYADPIPPPEAPIPLSPDDGAVFEAGTPLTLTWTDGDPFEQYNLQIAVGEDFSAPLLMQTLAHDLTELPAPALGEYAWRVQRVTLEGIAGAWSAVQRFSVVDGFWRLFDRSSWPYGGPDYGNAVASAIGGGAIILGRSGARMMVIVTDPRGSMVWEHRMPSSDLIGNACLPQPDGSVMIVGSTTEGSLGGDDLLYLEVLPSGDFTALETYGGVGEDLGYDVCRAADGGFAVIGATGSFGAGSLDAWLIRFDEQGHKLWERTYGGELPDGGLAIAATEDDGFVFAGVHGSLGFGSEALWCVRIDSEGEEVWSHAITHFPCSWGRAVAATPDGGFVVAGEVQGARANIDLVLLKIDAVGQLCWERTFGGRSSDRARALAVCPDGGLLVAAEHGNEGLWLLKTDGTGSEQWRRYYGSSDTDACGDLVQAAAGGYWLLGSNRSLTGEGSDIWLIKTDESGRAPSVR